MSNPELQANEQTQASTGLTVRPRPERDLRIARLVRPKLVARANAFFETCDGARASFNGFTNTHQRFTLEISEGHGTKDAFGIWFVTCLYLAGRTSWSDLRLRCTSIDDAGSNLLYEIADVAAGFVVRCDSIVVPTHDLTFAHEWSRKLAG